MSEFLKSARIKADLTQGEVSKVLKLTSPQFISNIERGLAIIPDEMILRISELYKVNPLLVVDDKLDLLKKRILKTVMRKQRKRKKIEL